MPKRFAVGSHLGSFSVRTGKDAAGNSRPIAAAAQRPPTIEMLEDRVLMSRTLFVAPYGNDASAGTLGQPFRTIQRAASVAAWGDTVAIRGGVYHETVRPRSGGVTFESYNHENVTVSGADQVGNWSHYSGNIYQSSSQDLGTGNNQVFVNGRKLDEAPYPNTNLSPSTPNMAHIGRYSGGTIYDNGLNFPNGYWNGATIHIIPGQGWVEYSGTVTGSGPGWIRVALPGLSKWEQPTGGNSYYLSGKLQGLNGAGEFYNAGGRLYVWAPGNANPNNTDVEVKHRQYAFQLGGLSNITLEGINIFAATVQSDWGSRNLTIDHVNAQYLSQFTPWNGWSVPNDSGIDLQGTGSVLENSSIAYSAGDGVYVGANGIRVINNVIHDVDYGGSDGAAVRVYASGDYIANNTIYNAGRDGINHRGTGLQILSNDISHVMLQTTDGGGIYTVHNNGGGSTIAYNHVHDIYAAGFGGVGIFMDDNSSNYSVHDNTTWNVNSGLKFNYTSYGETVYNNRLGAFTYSIESNGWTGFEYSWGGSKVYDNVFYRPNKIGTGTAMWGNVQAGGSPSPGAINAPAAVQTPPPVATPTPAPASVNAFSNITAQNFNATRGTLNIPSAVGWLDNGDYIEYSNLNFGNGATTFSASVAVDPAYAGQQIQIHLNSANGLLVGTLVPRSTGSWTNFVVESTGVSKITGTHDVYLVGAGRSGIGNISWFKFS